MTTSVLESFAAFCTTEGIDVGVFRRALLDSARAADSPFARVETGSITQDEFDVAVGALLSDASGRTIPSEGLKARMFAGVRPDLAMRDAVRAARAAGVRTALVSNSWGGGDYPLDELQDVFDAIVISGEIGMRKPNADIYLHSAGLVGVEPGACVFVDDFKVNIEGAEAVGMRGVLHREASETVARLEVLLGLRLGEG
jgi:putative hydrolase of the HAD superfamily